MKTWIMPLAGVGLLAAGGIAEAAAPAYCALYAREYANQFAAAAGGKPGSEQRIQDEAYYRCLNLDEDPELPKTSAYYGVDVLPDGVGGPLEPIAEGDIDEPMDAATDTADVIPADNAQPKPAAAPAKKQAQNNGGKPGWTSGAAFGTPEWSAWCKAHFPNSFDEKTGTIVPYGGARQKCE